MTSNLPSIYHVIRAMLGGITVALILGWIGMKLAWRIRLIDNPGTAPHKLHSRPTPLAGGIALLVSLIVCSIWMQTIHAGTIQATLIAGSVIFVFGLIDDYRILPPLAKLGGQILAAGVLIRLGIFVQIFESPEFFIHGEGPLYLALDWLVTIFWLVGITNAFNFVDSMDGLAVGLGAMSAAFFVLLTLDSQQFALQLHSAIIFGICLGLYFYNSHPALLFLGDSGAQTLGFALAVLAIAYSPTAVNQSSSWFVPIILLGIPIFDTILIVFSRLRRGLPVYTASHDHTYHRLSKLLGSSNRAVMIMHIAALLLSGVAVLGLNQPPAIANTIFILVIVAGLAALAFLETAYSWN